jgi:glycosyltransferase involved in cell wall biosynthesis
MDTRVLYVPGYVPDDQVQLYMNASDVAVFPYRRSLTSGALILAMSFGRACIAPRLPATTDVIDDGGGLSFDVTSPGGLAGVLRAAIGRRSELLAMGRLNRARAECWDWNTIARATAVRYEEAMAIAGATRS